MLVDVLLCSGPASSTQPVRSHEAGGLEGLVVGLMRCCRRIFEQGYLYVPFGLDPEVL